MISLPKLLLFVRLSRPLFLLGGLLLYALGAAIAAYLGRPIDAALYLVGQAIVTLLQLMTHYLNEYFDAEADGQNDSRTRLTGGSGAIGPEGLPKSVAFNAAVVSLALATTISTAALITQAFPLLVWPVLLLGFLGAFFYSTPPLRLVSTGYGELAIALVVAGLTPTFAYVLQTGELHRLLLMSTVPLIALCFAMIMVFELPDYATDVKHGKRNLMVRLGWSAAMRAHDVAIVFALISFAIAFMFGLPPRVGLGALIVVPLAGAQMWQLNRIRQGYPPKWTTLTFSALALFAIAAYLELAGYLLI
ncbi:MAG: 1,4-dihydroxy-2-naphthoate polyprenyltransferase [Anaerolineae bacterium]|nr:MAG: 1,4-dihydroxy-2-naphthoate polyprenyltransferase [Anaerolineae bacterium]